jgi:hypothetical protein
MRDIQKMGKKEFFSVWHVEKSGKNFGIIGCLFCVGACIVGCYGAGYF